MTLNTIEHDPLLVVPSTLQKKENTHFFTITILKCFLKNC